jgi:hypothetical protein
VPSALFPLAHGRGRKSKAGSKFRLRQRKFCPNCADIDVFGRHKLYLPLLNHPAPLPLRRCTRAVFSGVALNVLFCGSVNFGPINRRCPRLAFWDSYRIPGFHAG